MAQRYHADTEPFLVAIGKCLQQLGTDLHTNWADMLPGVSAHPDSSSMGSPGVGASVTMPFLSTAAL